MKHYTPRYSVVMDGGDEADVEIAATDNKTEAFFLSADIAKFYQREPQIIWVYDSRTRQSATI